MSGAWGGARKTYTGSRKMYDRVMTECPDIFPRLIDVFHLAAAIGILEAKRKTFKREAELLNMYSVDPEEVIAPVLMSLYPDASATDRYEMLLEFAEYGIEVISREVTETATFDPTPYLLDE